MERKFLNKKATNVSRETLGTVSQMRPCILFWWIGLLIKNCVHNIAAVKVTILLLDDEVFL